MVKEALSRFDKVIKFRVMNYKNLVKKAPGQAKASRATN